VGAYLRTEELADGLALAARIEVQYREEILGHLIDGQPDGALRARLPLGDIPEPL
jgi:hypothetical protein